MTMAISIMENLPKSLNMAKKMTDFYTEEETHKPFVLAMRILIDNCCQDFCIQVGIVFFFFFFFCKVNYNLSKMIKQFLSTLNDT